jgi:ketosteroid isomerase-like protein
MKLQVFARLALFAALAPIGGVYADAELSNADAVNELLQADIAWSKSFGAEEKDAFFGTLLSDAVLLAPNAPIAKGPGAFGGLLELPGVELTWQPASAEVASSGDMGYTFGTYELKFDGPDGQPVVDNGKYLTVWKRQADGSWKVAVDMFNTSVPM